MSESSGQSHEYEAAIPDFRAEIDAILGRTLTPENINNYADDALNDLVATVQKVTITYDRQHTYYFENGAEHEQAAFSYFGLDANGIERTLDYIADKSEEIRALDTVIHQITSHTDSVITPPSEGGIVLASEGGSFDEKRHIDRLKTLLFILANTFEVDLKDTNECAVLVGRVTDNMLRNEPYNLVTLPTLNRDVLICDEEGNVTYVFDSEELDAAHVTRDLLVNMDKDSINVLLASKPGIGYRLIHSELFTQKITSLIEHIPEQDQRIEINMDSGRLLGRSDIPDGFKSMSATAKSINITTHVARKAIDELGDLLGTVSNAKFSNGIRSVYSPEQQELIKKWVNENGYLEAPDGYASIHKMSEDFLSHDDTVNKAIAELGDRLGVVITAKIAANRTQVYSPEQQAMIREYMEEQNLIGIPTGEGYLTLSGLKDEFGVDQKTLSTIIAKHIDQIGEPILVRSGVRKVSGYSPGQIQVLRSLLNESGHLSPLAPEGYLSKAKFAEVSGISKHTINKAMAEMSDLGDPIVAKVPAGKATQISEVYSPEQQQKIVEYIETTIYTSPKAPEGYTSTKQIANQLSVADTTIRKAVEALGAELGDILHARVHSKTADTYSPDQQRVIRDWLVDNGYIATDADNDFLTLPAIARELGVSNASLQRIVQSNTDYIGEPKKIRANSNASSANGYSPEQQQLLRELLEETGIFADETPEGYLTRQRFVDQSGYSKFAITKAIDELGDELGECIVTRTGNERSYTVYSPEQQLQITGWLESNGYKPKNTAIGKTALDSMQ